MNKEQKRHSWLFKIGGLVITEEAALEMDIADYGASYLLDLHTSGEWGDLSDEDKQANDRAVKEGGQILSAYNMPNGEIVWIITSADRKNTTILKPDEY